jgi:hypothetical protein
MERMAAANRAATATVSRESTRPCYAQLHFAPHLCIATISFSTHSDLLHYYAASLTTTQLLLTHTQLPLTHSDLSLTITLHYYDSLH